MSVARPRTRVLYFRVSQEEFDQYTQACEAVGARSISDLARIAMQRMVGSGNQQFDMVANQLRSVDVTLEQILAAIERIDYRLQTQNNSGAGS